MQVKIFTAACFLVFCCSFLVPIEAEAVICYPWDAEGCYYSPIINNCGGAQDNCGCLTVICIPSA